MNVLGGAVFYALLRVLLFLNGLEECILKINWIAAVLLLVQTVAAVFGFTLDFGELGNQLLAVVNAVFAVLAILGVVTDPTTKGFGDSKQALTYDKPKEDE